VKAKFVDIDCGTGLDFRAGKGLVVESGWFGESGWNGGPNLGRSNLAWRADVDIDEWVDEYDVVEGDSSEDTIKDFGWYIDEVGIKPGISPESGALDTLVKSRAGKKSFIFLSGGEFISG
jgi:hypothetical protein